MGIFCPYCGRTIPSDSNICPYCERQINLPIQNQTANQIAIQPQNKSNKTITIIILVVVAVVLISIIAIPATIYVYVSGNLGTAPEMTPSIQLAKDNPDKTLTVIQADPNDLVWSDFEINGICDTSNLGSKIKQGDTITDCYGTITIRHISTNTLVGTWEFT